MGWFFSPNIQQKKNILIIAKVVHVYQMVSNYCGLEFEM
jgi:hypothetical protein